MSKIKYDMPTMSKIIETPTLVTIDGSPVKYVTSVEIDEMGVGSKYKEVTIKFVTDSYKFKGEKGALWKKQIRLKSKLNAILHKLI